MERKILGYSVNFWMLCFSSFFFFTSFNMMIPELPDHITAMGGEDYKGYLMGLFTITAGAMRPFSGKLTDKIGRIPVMVFGSVVCVLVGLIYPLATTVWFFLMLRTIHGLSTGFKPTGTAAYIADIVPQHKRGEAMGIYGTFGITAGMSLGPVIGDWVVREYDINTMFYLTSIFSLISVLVLFGLKETLKHRQPLNISHFKIQFIDVIEPKVLIVAVVMILFAFVFGVILTVIQDFSVYVGAPNKGIFFAIFSGAGVFVRIIGGKLSDKIGRRPVLVIVACFLTFSLVLLSQTTPGNLFLFYAAAVVYGLSTGIYAPALIAWSVDLANQLHRGRALSTIYLALEMGITIGAFLSAYIYSNNNKNFEKLFLISAILPFIALCYLIIISIQEKNKKYVTR